jgi:predicted HAD superfamily Cof-like phosphohydrolase
MHKRFGGTPDPETPDLRDPETRLLRAKLIFEECKELLYELGFEIHGNYFHEQGCKAIITVELEPIEVEFDLEKIAKESADLKVVTYGTDCALGINADVAFRAVNDSNMSKIGPNGEVVKREDGKILKGPYYREADMSVIWSNNDRRCSGTSEGTDSQGTT